MPEDLNADDVLVAIARNGDKTTYEKLKNKYMNFSKRVARDFMEQYPGSGVSMEEFEADGLIAFEEAYNRYTTGCGSFYPYWKQVASRLMIRDIHQDSYKYGARAFNGPFSFDESVKNNPTLLMGDVIGMEDREIKNFENRDRLQKLNDGIKQTKFTPMQKEVLKLFLQEYKISEIATILNIPYKRAYSLLTTVKHKIGIVEKSDK